MADFTEKTISSEQIYKGKIIDVQLDQVELPDGQTSSRELVYHPGAVAVLAVTPEGRLLMVRQYRKPLERSLVEIPAGKLENGEAPESCARRELEEETGYRSDSLQYVTSFYTSPGFSDEIVHLYFSNQLEKGEQKTDDDEFVELMEVTLEEAKELMRQKEIYDAKTAYAVQYLQLKNNLQDD
ncbi:MAG TPA: NUDIX hydrolase [Bacillales bacterium]|nr:NUDIX hydrolase [Bacillales bacterium]